MSICSDLSYSIVPHQLYGLSLAHGSSLAEAFLIAGTQRVVCSPWNVDDESTSEMMGDFFDRIASSVRNGKQVDYALALRMAQQAIRSKSELSSPYYWAPFVLMGDWR